MKHFFLMGLKIKKKKILTKDCNYTETWVFIAFNFMLEVEDSLNIEQVVSEILSSLL